jgi:hypothetical protein
LTTTPPKESPPRYLTPECHVGRTDPEFEHGCPSCRAPGYQHPVLGWMPIPCTCTCHTGPDADAAEDVGTDPDGVSP